MPPRRREVDRPLRKEVRLLGRMLGEVLIEQEGEELFALEERIRTLAIRRRPSEGRTPPRRVSRTQSVLMPC